jgi:hypothetical protein
MPGFTPFPCHPCPRELDLRKVEGHALVDAD